MKSVSLHGPWAFYERKCAEQDVRTQQLEGEVAYFRALAVEAKEQLSAAEAKVKDLQEYAIPSLHTASQMHLGLVSQLQSQLEEERCKLAQEQQQAAAREQTNTEQLQSLLADNVYLKSELTKHLQTRQVTSSKIEEARRKKLQDALSMTPSEAECFIKDLDETKAANKALRAEVAAVTADKNHLQQQCESRSSHAMTLISENKRLLEQVADLRRQVVNQDQDLWRLKQDLAAAQKLGAKAQQRKQAAAAAVKDRPQWQGTDSRRASAGGISSSSGSMPSTSYGGGSQGGMHTGGASRAVLGDATNAVVRQQSVGKGVKASGAKGTAAPSGDAAAALAQYELLAENVGAAPGSTGARHSSSGGARTGGSGMPGGAARAVRDAAEHLEGLRVAALQQALASRQQRLVSMASHSHA